MGSPQREIPASRSTFDDYKGHQLDSTTPKASTMSASKVRSLVEVFVVILTNKKQAGSNSKESIEEQKHKVCHRKANRRPAADFLGRAEKKCSETM